MLDSDNESPDADVLGGGGCPPTAHHLCAELQPENPGDADWLSYLARQQDLTVDLSDPSAPQGAAGEGDTIFGIEHLGTGAGLTATVMASRTRSTTAAR
jgi:hypothetical protein